MATELKTYDPSRVILTIGGHRVTGFAPGTFINIVRSQNNFDGQVGPDGVDYIRTKKNDRSALMTFQLQQTAGSNRVLSNLATRDEVSADGVVPCQILDELSPDTIFVTGKAWIQKPPDGAYGDSPQPRSWQVMMVEVPMTHGGTPGTEALTDALA